ncbi:uncharacterized protein LOC123539732 isoform X4 [Mercenaria mercenaria]|uniref:uncharacterized protein LOC123539732 isoform X4 n=1 Tax=Mercenaria mercenaria TaxID=6596 RepID=UPI00234F816A|nr:uncharacterized protein LOC123539732 isoform X4 [Mercenaria mercenaria]XP_053382622.1 uncharacterized protein LOC123539732 isoform X4 [Mercenaria mercenaria]
MQRDRHCTLPSLDYVTERCRGMMSCCASISFCIFERLNECLQVPGFGILLFSVGITVGILYYFVASLGRSIIGVALVVKYFKDDYNATENQIGIAFFHTIKGSIDLLTAVSVVCKVRQRHVYIVLCTGTLLCLLYGSVELWREVPCDDVSCDKNVKRVSSYFAIFDWFMFFCLIILMCSPREELYD